MSSAARILLIVLCVAMAGTRGVGTHVHLHDNHDQSRGVHGHVVTVLGDVHHGERADAAAHHDDTTAPESHVIVADVAVRAADVATAGKAFAAFVLLAVIFVLVPRAAPPRVARARGSVPDTASFVLLPPPQGPPSGLRIV